MSYKDREAELQSLCDTINHETDLEIQEEEETVKNLQQYGDFTKEQLEKWNCL
jgi:HEAT repeat protein